MNHLDSETRVIVEVEALHREGAEMFTRSINCSVDVPWPLGRTEYRPAIDKANSLVPHSAPSKPPLYTPITVSGSHPLLFMDSVEHILPALSLVTGYN